MPFPVGRVVGLTDEAGGHRRADGHAALACGRRQRPGSTGRSPVTVMVSSAVGEAGGVERPQVHGGQARGDAESHGHRRGSVNEHVAVDVRHGVGDRDLPRLVDDALDLGGDVDLAARIGERRVGVNGADQEGLGPQIQLARRAQGDFRRFLGGRRDREVSRNQGCAGLGQAQGDGGGSAREWRRPAPA